MKPPFDQTRSHTHARHRLYETVHQHAGTALKYVVLRRTPGTAAACAAGMYEQPSTVSLATKCRQHGVPPETLLQCCLPAWLHSGSTHLDACSQCCGPAVRMIVHPGTAFQSNIMHVPRHWRKSDIAAPTVCCTRFRSRMFRQSI